MNAANTPFVRAGQSKGLPLPEPRMDPAFYGRMSVGLHWLTLALFIAVYACIELREYFPKGSTPRDALKTWHFMLGLSVLLLASLRLMVNTAGPVPAIKPDPPAWQKLAARLVHYALYALMLGMPLAGWLLLSAEAKPIPFFGLQLPALIEPSKTNAELIKTIHETAGTVGYFIIGLHAAAALFHHYFVRDNTLTRILPQRFRSGGIP
jgi:cytochrome b561